MFFAQIRPLMLVVPLVDTEPCGINTRAAGRLVAVRLRTWVAAPHELASSPLLATMARRSAIGELLQGRGDAWEL